jgi:hypothetical protein|nr:MAG TPA: hypothetical protein [Caudoviricetes sp.]
MYKFIDGQKARFWRKFYYVSSDGFIVSKMGGKIVDIARVKYDCEMAK